MKTNISIRKRLSTALLILMPLLGCVNSSDKKPRAENNDPLDGAVKKNGTDSSLMYEAKNYRWLSHIYDGPVFESQGDNCYFRIVQIDNEEAITCYVERISIGDEGGRRDIQYHYEIDGDILSDKTFIINTVGSLLFVDSVTVVASLNSKKYKINLEKEVF